MSNVGDLIAIVALVIGAWWTVGRRLTLSRLKKDCTDIDATIVESNAVPDGLLWEVVAQFTPLESGVTMTIRDFVFVAPFTSGPAVGSKIQVVYSPGTPEQARLANSAM